MIVRNFTSHSIDLPGVSIPPAGPVTRLIEYAVPLAPVPVGAGSASVSISLIAYGDMVDAPVPRPGTLYVVSRLVATMLPGRRDLVFPYHPARDSAGRRKGCRSLAMLADPSEIR